MLNGFQSVKGRFLGSHKLTANFRNQITNRKQILNNKKVIIKKNSKIIFTFVENVVYKIDNIISKSQKKYLIKKYNKKVNYFYSEFKKIHQNQQYKNNKLFKIYTWYKSYFKK